MTTTSAALSYRFSRRSLLAFSGTAVALGSLQRFVQPLYAQEYEPSAFLAADTVHDISIEMDTQEFQEMVAAYQETGDKLWIEGTVTINGSVYEQSGLRLKGNSSLNTLLGTMGGRTMDGGEFVTDTTSANATPGALADVPDGFSPGGSGAVDPASVDPVTLPWLIKLDEFVNDQEHEGMTQLVIRSNNSETSLNEAVALNLLDKAGLASQQAAMVRFIANGSAPQLRLAIENPKGKWMKAHFPADGILFKSEAEGNWSYRGENYEDYLKIAFDLEAGDTGDDAEDFVPLIDFLNFLNNSEDSDFIDELPDRLEIDQFAVYLAMMDLIGNTDDIDGPGNNSYLYWNRSTGVFTVVPWDMNLAFGGFGMMGQGRGDNAGVPGGQFPGGMGEIPELFNAEGTPVSLEELGIPTTEDAMGTPGAAGMRSMPDGQTGFPGGNGGFAGQSNPLVTRFLANEEWTTLRDTTSQTLRTDLFESGVAEGILDQWVALLVQQATDLVNVDTIEQEASSISAFFEG